jgi:hypothetical protein
MILLFLVLLSCGTETEVVYRDIEYRDLGTPSEVWVCYNKGSDQHGKLCTPQCYGESKDNGKYCWLLKREECNVIEFAWQEENCHFFD